MDVQGVSQAPTSHVLEAVLSILNTGAQWHMLRQSYPNYKTVRIDAFKLGAATRFCVGF